LPREALEELRMLSNVAGEGGQALLQTILVGQPQLRHTLVGSELDQLRQRILASCHLGHLSAEETHAYVEHRMRAVGWDGHPAWGGGTLDAVHYFTDGVPRRINRLCARVLLAGELEQAEVLSAGLVVATALELEEDLGGVGPQQHAVVTAGLAGPGRRVTLWQRLAALSGRLRVRLRDLTGASGEVRR
jgi:hypothetical protein